MKTNMILPVFGLVAALVAAASGPAMAGTSQSIGVGGTVHQKHSVFTELPFDDGDLSYSVAYEYHDADAFWQLACDWTPEVGDGDAIDYAVTPQLNLFLTDRIFQGGVGILSTYTRQEDDSEWMDMYWQLLLGVTIPLPGAFSLEVNAHYVFESWGDLGDFDVKDVEGGAYFNYVF